MAKGQQRDLKREAFWRAVLARFGKSGLSVRAFCERERVSEPSFYAWRRVIEQRDAEHPRRRQVRPAFVPVVMTGPGEDAGITVQLRGGRVLRVPAVIGAERLRELIGAIESAPVVVEART